MLDYRVTTDEKGQQVIETSIHGKALLTIPQLNKGTAFTEEERHRFNLLGKLPNTYETLEQQVQRVYAQYCAFKEQINRNIHLNHLLNYNQVLFFRLVKDYIEEILPTIYTPVVGSAVTHFNHKFSQARGLYIAYEDEDRIEEILENRSNPAVDVIVVSDGEGVLGIGDQGSGAMVILIAKLIVYTVFGGIDPLRTLPIMLDTGTNNPDLLNSKLYLGRQQPRITGDDYHRFVDKFIAAVKKKMPHVLLHWEDIGRQNAYRNLVAYNQQLCSFNDDIQGTGVVATATVLSAIYHNNSSLADQRIVVFGAGSAGMGIADSICQAMQFSGLEPLAARQKFWLVDQSGLVLENSPDITDAQRPYARTAEEVSDWQLSAQQQIELLEVIKRVKPTILIGCSTIAGAFTQEIVSEMAQHVAHPIILPLSNPTQQAEAKPEDILRWTQGKALIATGSPFPPVHYDDQVIPISQCNNYLAFPGIGLGLISIKAKQLTDKMLYSASVALANYCRQYPDTLLPGIACVEQASLHIAASIVDSAIAEGVADAALLAGSTAYEFVSQQFWKPEYLPYRRI